ncbi:MAG: S-layer homology domain-containing protein, partial [Tissierellia bacterium]|nr:S-layer homology domain-containing protein [Tissierellia bacterium]
NNLRWTDYEEKVPPLPQGYVDIRTARAANDNETIKTAGVITSNLKNNNFTIQDKTAAINIYDPGKKMTGMNIGDLVEIEAKAGTFEDAKQLKDIAHANKASSSYTIFPKEIAATEIANYPSELIEIKDFSFESKDNKNVYTALKGNDNFFARIVGEKDDKTGKEVETFKGISQFEFDQWRIVARNDADVVLKDSTPNPPTDELFLISEIRELPKNTEVSTIGAITAINGRSKVIEDSTGGISIFDASNYLKDKNLGDTVQISGKVDEYNGAVQIQVSGAVETTENIVIEPKVIEPDEIANYPYQLIKIEKFETKDKFGDRNFNAVKGNIEFVASFFAKTDDDYSNRKVNSWTGVATVFKNQWMVSARNYKDVDLDGEPVVQLKKINEIQGNTLKSPISGTVITKGVVTATTDDYWNKGFFIHSLKEDIDKDPRTSEGLFIQTNNNKYNPGDIVTVEGTVHEREFTNWADQITVTSINARNITLEPTKYSQSDLDELVTKINISDIPKEVSTATYEAHEQANHILEPSKNALDFFESLENMPVKISDPQVLAATEEHGDINVLPDRGEGISAVRTPNGGIKYYYDSPNTQKLTISDKILPITRNKKWKDKDFNPAPGSQFEGDVEGIIIYAFSEYKLLNYKPLPKLVSSKNVPDSPKFAGDDDSLLIAEYNIENFSALDTERANKLANHIIDKLSSADLVGLVEVQDNDGPGTSAGQAADKSMQLMVDAIIEMGGPEYGYVNIDPAPGNLDGGQPNANIRTTYLYKKDKLKLVEGTAGTYEKDTQVINKDGKASLTLNPGRIANNHESFRSVRKPLVAQFEIIKGAGTGKKLIAINNHLSSKRGDAPIFGPARPETRYSETKRNKQAEVIRDFVKEILKIEPDALVAVMGDMNDFEFSNTLEIMKEAPLVNMIDRLPENEKYSYVFQGNSQVLDHILLSNEAAKYAGENVDILNINAEFGVAQGRASDHDPVLVKLDFNNPQTPQVDKNTVRFEAQMGLMLEDAQPVLIEKGAYLSKLPKVHETNDYSFVAWTANKAFGNYGINDSIPEEVILNTPIETDITFIAKSVKKYLPNYPFIPQLDFWGPQTDEFNSPTPDPIIIEISPNANYYEAFDGLADENFNLDALANRGEVIEALERFFNISGGVKRQMPTDVEISMRALVQKFIDAKILDGFDDGLMHLDRHITRAEMAKIICIMMDYDLSNNNIEFDDAKGHWAENYLQTLVEKGLLKGYPEGDIKPDGNITKAEVIAILDRLIGRDANYYLEKYGMRNHWLFQR